MSSITLCKHRYIGLRNSGWAEISVFLIVNHDCIHMYIYTFIHIYTYTHIYVHICIYVCIFLYIYICIHIYIYIYTYTYVETPFLVCYFSNGPRYGINHTVISVPRTGAKVPYREGRLDKNTFNGTRVLRSFDSWPCDYFLVSFVVRGDWLGSSARMAGHHSVHGIEPATFRIPRDFFGDVSRQV